MRIIMIKGVTEVQEKIIHEVLSPYKNDFDFFYYGSRVKGNFSKPSDLDILIKGKEKMPYNILERLKVLFDISNLPYVVNFADYNNIDEHFYNLIKNDLVNVFE